MKYDVPGVGIIEINTIVLDLNGTLSVCGEIPEGVKEKIDILRKKGCTFILFTGDQRGTAKEICSDLGIKYEVAKNAQEKEGLFRTLDAETTAAIGNARIDIGTLKLAKVAVGTLQAEGMHTGIIPYVDALFHSIGDALDFFIDPDIFKATMRK